MIKNCLIYGSGNEGKKKKKKKSKSGNYVRNTGRQPSSTFSVKVGTAAAVFQTAHGNRSRRAVDIPTLIPPEMRSLFVTSEHRLISECILKNPTRSGAALIFRAKQEMSPSADGGASLQKYILQLGAMSIAFGPDILLLLGASEQLKWVTTLWTESKKDTPTYTHEADSEPADTLYQSGGTLPLDQQSREASFVLVDDVSVDGLVNHNVHYPNSHFHALRKTLFGAAESVVGALNRRKSQKAHELGSGFCCNAAQEPALLYNEDGHVIPSSAASNRYICAPQEDADIIEMPVLTQTPKSPQRVNPLDPDSLNPDAAMSATTPQVGNDTRETIGDSPQVQSPSPLTWLSEVVAVHVTVNFTSLDVMSYPQLNRDPALDRSSASQFSVSDISVRLLCNNDSSREVNPADTAWHKKLDTPKESSGVTKILIPITCVLKIGAIASRLQAPVLNILQNYKNARAASPFSPIVPSEHDDDAMSACSIPITMSKQQLSSKKQCGKLLVPFVYCSAVINEIDVWVMYNTTNYVRCNIKSLSTMATNRAAGDTIQPLGRNDDRGKTPVSTTSMQKGHKTRPSDEQMTHFREKSDGSLLHSPRSRSGSLSTHPSTRKKSFAGFQSSASISLTEIPTTCPDWVISFSLDKNSFDSRKNIILPTKDSITVSYNCRPFREGEIEEKPTEIISTRIRSFHASVLMPSSTTSTTPAAAHVFIDGVHTRVTSHEWYHTDHCLREWEKLVLRWESNLSRQPERPCDIGSPHIQSPGPEKSFQFEKAMKKDISMMLTFTLDLKRCEIIIPLTANCNFLYTLRRIIISSSLVEKCTVVRARLHTSVMKVADEREVILPGVRVTYCSGPNSSFNCHIDRLDVHLTPEIINSWLHMYTTVAPQILKLFESRSNPPTTRENATDPVTDPTTGIVRASVQWCGIKVSLMGTTSELVIGSGMGLVRYRTSGSGSADLQPDEFTVKTDGNDKVCFFLLFYR